MRRVVIKVCGITEERDAIECSMLGVDAVGFNFWKGSPRYVEPARVRRIVDRLPVLMPKIGVFVDEVPIRVLEIAREAGVTALQFHGEESPAACAAVAPFPWYKALRVGEGFDASSLGAYPCTTFLLDAHVPGVPGGTGTTFDWSMARGLSVYGRILVAGGLTPENVAQAIEAARPYGVDVASGVEFLPGQKDLDRLEAFVAAVRGVESRLEEQRR